MTIFEARKAMMDFLTKNNHKSVLFATLSEEDKFTYVMIKSFKYYDFLKRTERIARAIENAEAHQKSNFEFYLRDVNEHMVITD